MGAQSKGSFQMPLTEKLTDSPGKGHGIPQVLWLLTGLNQFLSIWKYLVLTQPRASLRSSGLGHGKQSQNWKHEL